MSNKYNGYEWCPYCEWEHEYEVGRNTMISTCECCGRPILLCDKCDTMCRENGIDKSCGSCKWEEKIDKKMKEWEKKQAGKKVWWNDPDDDICSGWYVVESVEECNWVLKNNDGSVVECTDDEIDFEKKED